MSVDVRELLGKAAAKPASVLDVAALARTARHRRVVRAACAVAATAAIVVLVVVVSLPGVDRRGVQSPLRPVPSTAPDVSKTHAIGVTPSTGLRDGQPIRLSGGQFVVGVGHHGQVSAIELATCRAGATPANWGEQCDQQTSAGTAASDIRSRTPLRNAELPGDARANCCVDMAGYRYSAARHLNLPGGPVDCALESCVVIAIGFDRGYGIAPLQFDPNAASDVTVDHRLLVSPSTGLRDGQPIRLSGGHFVVSVGHGGGVSAIYLATCLAGATPSTFDQQCDRRTSAGAAAGDIRSRTPLRKADLHQAARTNCCVDIAGYHYSAVRHLYLPGGSVDCALESCVVIAVGSDRGYGIAPLRFDPNAASLPTPRVTVTPNSDLHEGQQVTIHIEDAWPRSIGNRFGAAASLCAPSGIAPVCHDTDLGVDGVWPIDSRGRADLTMTVRSTVLSAGYGAGATAGVADCAQPPGCVIGVQVPTGPLEGQTAQLAVPITFSSDVSARPLADRLPQATIDPPAPYTDGQHVTITATGVPKGTAVSQCAKPDSQAVALRLVSCAPESVTATGTLVLHRFIDGLGGDPIDCAEPGHCTLYLHTADPNHEGMLGHGPLLELTPLTVS